VTLPARPQVSGIEPVAAWAKRGAEYLFRRRMLANAKRAVSARGEEEDHAAAGRLGPAAAAVLQQVAAATPLIPTPRSGRSASGFSLSLPYSVCC
jgi:hypothetical protein